MRLPGRDRHTTAATVVVLLVAWEIAGRLHLVASGALPAPSEILMRLWVDRADYARTSWRRCAPLPSASSSAI